MTEKCVWEHNGNDTLLWSVVHIGTCTRGKTLDEAKAKAQKEISAYCAWMGEPICGDIEALVCEEKVSDLQISDADSDVIFELEKAPLTKDEYFCLKALAMKSAHDFQTLYDSIPDKDKSVLLPRKTFYGEIPRTACEMYEHTKNVNNYYFGEIGIETDNAGLIAECRERGFALVEGLTSFPDNTVIVGSYGEEWSLRKVLRRFIWHDRIHAKAMLRAAKKTFPNADIADPFLFEEFNLI